MENLKRLTPIFFTIVGFIGIGTLAMYRMAHLVRQPSSIEGLMQGVAFFLYAAWMIWESRISINELKKPKTDHDHGTLELCAVVKLLLLLAIFAPESRIIYPGLGLGLGGIVLILLGILLRGGAILKLGHNYSHRIRVLKAAPVCSGPYRIIRHPAYLGTLLVHTGLVTLFLNPYSLLMLCIWFAAVLIRTLVEDHWLLTFAKYRAYAKKVKWRLLPGIF